MAGFLATSAAQAAVCRAAPGGTGLAGTSWGDAMSLTAALANSNCTDIWLKQGVYKPTSTATDPTATFAINRPLKLYGGFMGTEATLEQRQANSRLTVLSGDIDGNDTLAANGSTATAADIVGGNSYNVVVIGGLGTTSANGPYTPDNTLIDGLTITGGDAEYGNASGGGLYCNGRGSGNQCSPTVSNTTFSGNRATGGGAIYNDGYDRGTSSPAIMGSTFSGNLSFYGGALYNYGSGDPDIAGSGGTSSPTISNSTFSGNTALFNGGAMVNISASGGSSEPRINHSTFSANSAGMAGGVLYISGPGFPIFSNSVIWGNTAPAGPFFSGSPGQVVGVGGSILPDMPGTFGIDPQLGPLANNGGPTDTLLPASDGSAIDKLVCFLLIDQRGLERPAPVSTAPATPCDIGAVEVGGVFNLLANVSGQGVVAGSAPPSGIHCDPDDGPGQGCYTTFQPNAVPQTITLTATPDDGWVFAGWSGGGCDGTAVTCTLAMDQTRDVTATFKPLAAVAPTPVPTLGQWALVLLSLLTATVGAGRLRGRASL